MGQNKMDTKISESLVKYLAGLLDADGSLSFQFRRDDNKEGRYFISLRLSLTASDAVDHGRFVETLPITTGMGTTARYGKNNQFCSWIVAKRADLERLLPRLVKHMAIKAKHWKWLLDTWREYRSPGYGERGISADDCERLRQDSKKSRVERSGPLKAKNYPTWAWLAGYLDGDGWYRNNPIKNRSVRIIQIGACAHVNDSHVLEFIKNSLGGLVYRHTTPSVMVWRLPIGVAHRSAALRVLPKLARHARLKRHKIDQIIHYHRQRLSVPTPTGEAIV